MACWQRTDLRRGFAGRVALFGVNTDGADYALYSANHRRRINHMPCQTTAGLSCSSKPTASAGTAPVNWHA